MLTTTGSGKLWHGKLENNWKTIFQHSDNADTGFIGLIDPQNISIAIGIIQLRCCIAEILSFSSFSSFRTTVLSSRSLPASCSVDISSFVLGDPQNTGVAAWIVQLCQPSAEIRRFSTSFQLPGHNFPAPVNINLRQCCHQIELGDPKKHKFRRWNCFYTSTQWRVIVI